MKKYLFITLFLISQLYSNLSFANTEIKPIDYKNESKVTFIKSTPENGTTFVINYK